jgi:hypothetical protein
MDDRHFDSLARRVCGELRHSRRVAVATLLGATLLRHDLGTVLAKKQAKTTTRAADACYPGGTTCAPGKGKNTSGCDFAHSTVFANKDVRGANLSHNNFFAADLRGADFRGSNLSGGCFVSADLTGAKLGSSVNLDKAVFCNTTMPDGTINDSGCEGETPCCHQRLQDCPDAHILCFAKATPPGICGALVGRLGPVGRCYQFPAFCCPCAHDDLAFWETLCNQTFPEGCNGQCLAEDDAVLNCWDTCSD